MALTLLIPGALVAQETEQASDAADSEAIIEQILELREQLEALLSTLPPDLRQEVERRWQARSEEPADTTPSPSAPSEPTAEVAQPVPEQAEISESLEEPAAEVVADESASIPEQATPSEPECVHLAAFDTNGDRVISAGDRYWRYLRLWTDNGDGVVDEDLEIGSLFTLDIRDIRVELDYYSQPDDLTGDILVQDAEVKLLLDDAKGRPTKRATLVVQADRLSRGGEIRLTDASSRVLSGYQPIGPEVFTETEDGERLPLVCPQEVP